MHRYIFLCLVDAFSDKMTVLIRLVHSSCFRAADRFVSHNEHSIVRPSLPLAIRGQVFLAQSGRLRHANVQLERLASQGRLDQCLTICQTIRDSGEDPNVDTYNSLLSACASQSYYQEAIAFYEDMVVCGIEPNSATFSHLIRVRQLLRTYGITYPFRQLTDCH